MIVGLGRVSRSAMCGAAVAERWWSRSSQRVSTTRRSMRWNSTASSPPAPQSASRPSPNAA